MSLITKIINTLKYFQNKILIDRYVDEYIKFNKQKWKYFKVEKPKGVILVDLFENYSFIHLWSYLTNVLAKKESLEIKYFYFYFYRSKFERTFLYLRKVKKIYESFNVKKGIDENDFISIKNFKENSIEKKFKNLKTKTSFINFTYRGIIIGDLIYDTYLRNNFKPTLDLKDKYLLDIFKRAIKIFDQVEKYFNNNNVKLVIPSHTNYIQYGIITRIALKKRIKVFKILESNRGSSDLRFRNIEKKFPKDTENYFLYKRKFTKFTNKKKLIKIGKKILINRLSGKKDKSLPYMVNNSYKTNKNKENKELKNKNKIIIFAHCFFDSPHKHRNMIFNDFYEQLIFILSLSRLSKKYYWYIKPHPNSYFQNDAYLKEILKNKFNNVKILNKNLSNKIIAESKPSLVITDHGSIGHEMAYYEIPVLNTGDNPHINYNFNIHAKCKKDIIKTIKNLNSLKKKINFDKKYIYEFIYMHFVYRFNKENENKYIKSNFFGKELPDINGKNKILSHIIKMDKKYSRKINLYTKKFINNHY